VVVPRGGGTQEWWYPGVLVFRGGGTRCGGTQGWWYSGWWYSGVVVPRVVVLRGDGRAYVLSPQ